MTFTDSNPWFAGASRKLRWLVGVSGGADSVALFHLLIEGGFRNLVVCHLDHRLRGRTSTEDAKFVSRLAAKSNIACEVARADVRGRMAARGESLETAARNARLEFFGDCARKFRCPRILLAHHADDQAETVLWNLLRGSYGMKGMRGEQPMRTDSGMALDLIRPLLGIRRAELIRWLESQGHRWREDASNAEPIAVRNRLRNEALPLLEQISGRDPVPALVRGAADTGEMEALETWALDHANVRDPQGRLHLPVLRELPVALQRIALRKFLQDHEIGSLDRAVIEKGLELLDVNNPPAVNLPGGGKLRRREGRLWIEC